MCGDVGDVKFSLLAPDVFRVHHGTAWIPLDGLAWATEQGFDFTVTALHKAFGVATLPDARGVFIRAMNSGRDPKAGDPEHGRLVGSSQPDTLKRHEHPQMYSPQNFNHNGAETLRQVGHMATQHSTGAIGDDETRPRNIALYVYVKVDDAAPGVP